MELGRIRCWRGHWVGHLYAHWHGCCGADDELSIDLVCSAARLADARVECDGDDRAAGRGSGDLSIVRFGGDRLWICRAVLCRVGVDDPDCGERLYVRICHAGGDLCLDH